jgi:type II secretory pathway component GspD/PulD (secretin)
MYRAMLAAVIVAASAHAQEKDHAPKVTLKLEKATISEAAAQISTQAGVDVLVVGDIKDEITLDLKDADVEAAVSSVAEACQGSWLRTYAIETGKAAGQKEGAEQVLERLRMTWRTWFLRRTEEELDAFGERAREAAAAEQQQQQGQPQRPAPTAGDTIMWDPLEAVKGPFHLEQITLQLQGAPVQDAIDKFMLESGYPVLLEQGLEGAITLDVKAEKLSRILDAVAEQLAVHWRMLYLIGQPHEMTADEMQQRLTQGLEQLAGWFFGLPPDQRQTIMQQAVQRLQSIPAEDRDRMRQSPWAPRIMQTLMLSVTQLTPDQRREVSPLLKGLAGLLGQ